MINFKSLIDELEAQSAARHGPQAYAARKAQQALAEAREILSAMEAAKARGEGATVYKGRLVDIASIRQAEVIVRMSDMFAG